MAVKVLEAIQLLATFTRENNNKNIGVCICFGQLNDYDDSL